MFYRCYIIYQHLSCGQCKCFNAVNSSRPDSRPDSAAIPHFLAVFVISEITANSGEKEQPRRNNPVSCKRRATLMSIIQRTLEFLFLLCFKANLKLLVAEAQSFSTRTQRSETDLRLGFSLGTGKRRLSLLNSSRCHPGWTTEGFCIDVGFT